MGNNCCGKVHVGKNQRKYKLDVNHDQKQAQLIQQITQKVQSINGLLTDFEARLSQSKAKIKKLKEEASEYIDNEDQQDYLNRLLQKIARQKYRSERINTAIQGLQNRKAELQQLQLKTKTTTVYKNSHPDPKILQEINQTLKKIQTQNNINSELNRNIKENFENIARDNELKNDVDVIFNLKKELKKNLKEKLEAQKKLDNQQKGTKDQQLNKKLADLAKQNKQLKERINELQTQSNASFVSTKSVFQNKSLFLNKLNPEQKPVFQKPRLLPNYDYLFKLFKDQKTVDSRYFQITKQMIEACQKSFNFTFTQKGYRLNHEGVKVNMEVFVMHDWSLVESIWLNNCQIDDEGWKVFVDNSGSFSNLKTIRINQNQIRTVDKGDLQKFVSLRYIVFAQNKTKNPLSFQSKAVIKQFKMQNPHIKVDIQ